RSLPHQDLAYVRQQAERVAEGITGVEIEINYTAEPNNSPYGTAFTDQAAEAVALALGEPVKLMPALAIGFTDSRFVRPIGQQVYGYMPSPPDREDDHGVHGV